MKRGDVYRRLFDAILIVQKRIESMSCRIGNVYINIESMEKEQPNLIMLRIRKGLYPKDAIAITLIELTEYKKKDIIKEIEGLL